MNNRGLKMLLLILIIRTVFAMVIALVAVE